MSPVPGLPSGDDDTLTAGETGSEEGERALILGHYRVDARVGVGGMGEVFAAHDLDNGERVALKRLSRAHAISRYRFKQEFRALADLRHPNLVRLHELVVPERGAAYFTMEFIEGEPFVAWVRRGLEPGQLPPLERVERALGQLLAGVAELHERGFVHRDIKPSNVLIEADGRVVLLDLGIVLDLEREAEGGMTRDGQILGTPRYMAPEQALGSSVGAPADLYAIGVMLYECLTGRPPFTRSLLRQLQAGEFEPTPDPSAVLARNPGPLGALCRRLMARAPEQRPSAREALGELQGLAQPPGSSPSSASSRVGLIGRERELAWLAQRCAGLLAGEGEGPRLAVLSGPAGYGKSALLREFGSRAQREAGVVVLRSDCRERESLPYKGIDGAIDELAIYLRRRMSDTLEGLAPQHLDALVRVFPILAGVWATPSPELVGSAPNASRALAWAALRELLSALSMRVPLMLVLDDFQWANAESVGLLRELLRRPSAARLLVVVGLQGCLGRELPAPGSARELGEQLGVSPDTLELGPLGPEASLALALASLRRGGRADQEGAGLRLRAEALAQRAGGDPMFIIQAAMSRRDEELGVGDLGELIARQLDELEPQPRALAELVAVADGPLALSIIEELRPELRPEQLEQLCASGLLIRGEERVDTAHAQVREQLLAGLEAPRRRALHRELAELLTARDEHGDDESVFRLVEHWIAAIDEVEALEAGWRVALAELYAAALERSLDAAAWTTAKRYGAAGHELVHPFLVEASGGGPLRVLCLRISFGHAQALAMCARTPDEYALADASFDALLGWSLSTLERGTIVSRRVAIATYQQRWAVAVELGLAGLAELGRRSPREPSLPRTLIALGSTRRALAGHSLDSLAALAPIEDPRAEVEIQLLDGLSQAMVSVDPGLFLLHCCAQVRRILERGYHPTLPPALARLAMPIAIIGSAAEAEQLCERALKLCARRQTAASNVVLTELLAVLFVWHHTKPFAELAARIEPLHRAASDAGLLEYAGYVASIGVGISLEAPLELGALAQLVARFDAKDSSYGTLEAKAIAAPYRNFIAALIHGEAPLERGALGEQTGAIAHLVLRIERLALAVLRGESERAWLALADIPSDYVKILLGNWHTPRCAMFGAVTIGERWAQLRGRERRRARRRLRGFSKLCASWAAKCPTNYGPMAAIAAGELARVSGDEQGALGAFERARSQAAASGVAYLEGLAYLRLASEAAARGHEATAASVRRSAAEVFRRWGAEALASRYA